MIGTGGAVEVRLVTAITSSRRVDIVVVHMTLRTGQARVRPGKRVVGIKRVVEGDRSPVGCVMAGIAGCGERSADVVWICGSGEIRLVTAIAGGGER